MRHFPDNASIVVIGEGAIAHTDAAQHGRMRRIERCWTAHIVARGGAHAAFIAAFVLPNLRTLADIS